MILDIYTKSSVRQQTTSEGTIFDQMDEAINKHIPPYDKKYWGNMQCFRCLQKGCLALHFTKKITNANSAKTFYDKKLIQFNQVSPLELTRQQV